jgi:hypothetical protein
MKLLIVLNICATIKKQLFFGIPRRKITALGESL